MFTSADLASGTQAEPGAERLGAAPLTHINANLRDKHQHTQQVQTTDLHQVYAADPPDLFAEIHSGCVVPVQWALALVLSAGSARRCSRYLLGRHWWHIELGRRGHGLERRLDLLIAILHLPLIEFPGLNVLPQYKEMFIGVMA